MYKKIRTRLIPLTFCCLLFGSSEASENTSVSRIIADYAGQIEKLKAVTFTFDITYRRIDSVDVRSIERGEVQYGNKTLYMFFSQLDPDGTESSRYERLVRLGTSYVSCLEGKGKDSLTVHSALHVEALEGTGEPQNNLGPWGILWGRIEVAPSKTLVLPEFLREYQFKQGDYFFQEDGSMILKCAVEDEKIHMDLHFVRRDGQYSLKELVLNRDPDAWNPQSISYFRYAVDKFVHVDSFFLSEEFTIEQKVPKGTFVRNGRELVSPGSASSDRFKINNIELSINADKPSFQLRTQIPNYTPVHCWMHCTFSTFGLTARLCR